VACYAVALWAIGRATRGAAAVREGALVGAV